MASLIKAIDVTAKPIRMHELAGWYKIFRIEGETFLNEHGQAEYEMIWITDNQGFIYMRELLKGETVDGVMNHYAKRGYTDDACTFYKAPVATIAPQIK